MTYIESVYHALLAVFVGSLVAPYWLEIRRVLCEPIPIGKIWVDVRALRSVLLVYFCVPILVLLGVASFLVPPLPREIPRYVSGGMAVAIVGVIRLIAIRTGDIGRTGELGVVNTLVIGIAAAFTVTIYAFLTAQTLVYSAIGAEFLDTVLHIGAIALSVAIAVEFLARVLR